MDIAGKLVVAALTHNETRIWATDATRGEKPETVARPNAENVHHHIRQDLACRPWQGQIRFNAETGAAP